MISDMKALAVIVGVAGFIFLGMNLAQRQLDYVHSPESQAAQAAQTTQTEGRVKQEAQQIAYDSIAREPTITPSAISAAERACSGVEMPKPA